VCVRVSRKVRCCARRGVSVLCVNRISPECIYESSNQLISRADPLCVPVMCAWGGYD